MRTKEPLLRSDWRIFRGGALFIEGAEHIAVKNCEFTQLGGNALFASGYNRKIHVSGCHFHQIGASAICFVGDTSAVHNPMFIPYGPPTPWHLLDKQNKGPKSPDYPAHCVAEDCLIHDIGLLEKQVAGLQISVAHAITGRHLSIYDVPRAGINISENAFGGHLIEGCDVFDTVRESADHGSFNSWGRDRFWHTDYRAVDRQVAEHPQLPLLDILGPNIIRNSRWRCDHGWDIDLDYGSSGYLIENNLCLGGGIKLREGYHRTVRNNLVIANTFHPHVWFQNSQDIITANVWATPVEDIQLTGKGRLWDRNIHLTQIGLAQAQISGVDPHGIHTALHFTDPDALDFTFPMTSAIRATGFTPFDQSNYGVHKPALKKLARTPEPPAQKHPAANADATRIHKLLGALMKPVTSPGEVSATGLPAPQGVLVLNINHGSKADQLGLKANDVIRAINHTPVNSCEDLILAWALARPPVKFTIWRMQRPVELPAPSLPGRVLPAKNAAIHGTSVFDPHKNYIGRWTDANTSLSWKTSLPPNQRYRVIAILASAAPAGQSPHWQLEGMTTSLTGPIPNTGDWEHFVPVIADAVTLSRPNAPHTLTLRQDPSAPAPINLRALILLDD